MNASDTTPSSKRQLNNTTVRILTGMVLIPLALLISYIGSWVLFAVLLVVVVVGMLEFYHMEQQRYLGGNVLLGVGCGAGVMLGFYFASLPLILLSFGLGMLATFLVEMQRSRQVGRSLFRILTTLGGVCYLALPSGGLIMIRAIPHGGLWWIFAVYLATWGTDSVAYFVGRKFGRTPLAPQLSPKKTVEGAVGGIVGGILLPLLLLTVVQLQSWTVVLLLIVAPFVAIGGDLFESALKRYFGLKDSGLRGLNPFPGHGGVLDRVDSLIWVTALFYAYLVVAGRIGF